MEDGTIGAHVQPAAGATAPGPGAGDDVAHRLHDGVGVFRLRLKDRGRDQPAAAHRNGKPVGVCGELAGDPAAAVVLLGLGVDSLSMSVGSLPRVKWVLRTLSQARARELTPPAAVLALGPRHNIEAHYAPVLRANLAPQLVAFFASTLAGDQK